MKKTINLPTHVAIILDGNGRWAEQRDLPRLEGHRAGVKNISPVLKYLNQYGIRYVTLYVFSTENWRRPADEVNGIFQILDIIMAKEARALHKIGFKIHHVGRIDGISPKLQKKIKRCLEMTSGNTGLNLGLAFNYGGRAEILDAMRKCVASGVPVDEIDEKSFGQYLYTAGFPEVDLVIRTGGEIRTSNFLIWQAAYAEYYFTSVLWPDFDEAEMEKALRVYSRRQRRFGGL